MKTLFYINNIIIGIILVSGILGFVQNDLWGTTVWGTLGLGLYQSITGFLLFVTHPRRVEYLLYILGLVSFFIVLRFSPNGILWIFPITLGLYFTFILYNNSTKKIVV